jgi:hypothetical protein
MKIRKIERHSQNRIHIKSSRRFLTILVVISLLTYLFFIPTITSGTQKQEFVQVMVEKGETLWDIAHQFDPQGDLRKLVYEIKEFNNLESYSIISGTYIKIPL